MGNKFKTDLCNDKMTFNECELAILRHAVDETTEVQGKQIVHNEEVQRMISILENFLIRKKQICYGGTAINNILPKSVQFYNKDVEIPDYDFFSKHALEDAKELADIYYNEGFSDVEAKSGVHKGTYKVFVNFIPIADITYMHPEIYDNLEKEAITIMGIRYCPPNYLRMSMYLELSRPAGDVTRWEKVLKRIVLLNKHYPLKSGLDCKKVSSELQDQTIKEDVFMTIKNCFIEQEVVFFGGYSAYLYSRYMPKNIKRLINKVPQFDVLAKDPDKCALIVKERLFDSGVKNVEIIEHEEIEEIIPKHFEIKVNKKSHAFVYEPIACHNYNTVEINGEKVKVATIDTMMSFYLAFIYTNNEHYNKERILCLAKYLFEVEQHNRLEQTGVLKRFNSTCYGTQKGLSSIRAEKTKMFKKLHKKKGTKEYEEWFLKYVPEVLSNREKVEKRKKIDKILKKEEEEEEDEYKEEEEGEEGEEEYTKESIEKIPFKKFSRFYKQKKERKEKKEKKKQSRNQKTEKKQRTKKNRFFENWFNRKTRKGFLF